MATNPSVFIGIRGTVLALDRATGEELWRRPLVGSDFVNVALVEGDLFATSRGELFALDPGTGEVRWHNPLKGLGRGLLTIAAGAQQAVVMSEKKRRDAQAAAAAGAAGASAGSAVIPTCTYWLTARSCGRGRSTTASIASRPFHPAAIGSRRLFRAFAPPRKPLRSPSIQPQRWTSHCRSLRRSRFSSRARPRSSRSTMQAVTRRNSRCTPTKRSSAAASAWRSAM